MNNNFRILTLSGGGYRGLYAAKVLADLEEQTNQPIGRYFDLIAGTSIGGIVALAVAHEIPMKDVVDMFVEHGQNIFKKQRFSFFSTLKSTYGSEQLKTEISRLFLDDKIGDLKHNVIVPAINFSAGRPVVFKTPHHQSFFRDAKHDIVDVAMATSAAPIYFPKYHFKDANYVDGGLFANNPSLLAIHEAQHFFEVPKENIYLLHVGTLSSHTSDVYRKNQQGGMTDWANGVFLNKAPKNIIELTLASQQQMMTHMTRHTLGDRYFDIDSDVSKNATNYIGLDRADEYATKVLLSHAQEASKDALGSSFISTLLKETTKTPTWIKNKDLNDE